MTVAVEKLALGVHHNSRPPKFSDALLLTAAQVGKWCFRTVFVLVVARALGPTRFGVYALLFAMVEFLAVASGSGYADYLTREAAKDPRAGWGLAFQLMVVRVGLAIPIVAIEIGVLYLLRYPHLVLEGTAWMALTLVPRSVSEAVQGVLRGIHEYAGYIVIDAVLGAGLVAGAGVLLVRHGGIGTAIGTEVTAAGMAGLAGSVFALKFKTKEQIWLGAAHLAKSSAIFNMYSFIGTLYDRFDVVLLSKLAGDYATGVYSVAYRAVAMTQVVGYGVLYSLLPTLSGSVFGEKEERKLERAMGLLLAVGFLLVLATVVFADPAIRLVLGARYAESAEALKMLSWVIAVRYMNYALNVGLLATGRERVFVITSLSCLAANLAGNLILIPVFGWRGAAFLTLITELILLAQNIYWIRRLIGRVPMPLGMARTSIAFTVLLGATLAGGHLGSSIVVGTVCLASFAVYLLGSGMVTEFASVWGAQRDSVGQSGLG